VTLFSENALAFKHIVYEMRFDEVSALFGEFGNFLVGNILDEEGLEKMLKKRPLQDQWSRPQLVDREIHPGLGYKLTTVLYRRQLV
jgi:hypothetical protein